MARLTHFDKEGKAAMVDVGAKPESERVAVARGRSTMQPQTMALVISSRGPLVTNVGAGLA